MALTLAGCATIEQQQFALEALREEVQAFSTELRGVEDALSALGGQVREFEQAVDVRLADLDNQLAKPIEYPTPVCEFPELPLVETTSEDCEAPVELVIDNGSDKLLVGSVEEIRLTPPGVEIKARIDTGANSSSLNATDLVYFERDGEDWVRFNLIVTDEDSYLLEREVRRFVRVYSQSDTSGDRRPVVRMRVELGNIRGNFEFNLSDRRHLEHPVILGRNLLVDLVVVDVSEEYMNPLDEDRG